MGSLKTMAITAIPLLFLMPAIISGLPQKQETSCSSQTCIDCIGSCGGCGQCNLCIFCPFGIKIGPCAQCGYCAQGGGAGCMATCNQGKKTKTCKRCIQHCQ